MNWYGRTLYKEAGVALDVYNNILRPIVGKSHGSFMQWANPYAKGSTWGSAQEEEKLTALEKGKELTDIRDQIISNFQDYLKANGLRKLDQMSPMMLEQFKQNNKKLIDNFETAWEELVSLPRTISRGKNVEKKRGAVNPKDVYNNLILKALYEKSQFSEFKINYSASYFQNLTSMQIMKGPYQAFQNSIVVEKKRIKTEDGFKSKKVIVDYDQNLLLQLVEALYNYAKNTFDQDYLNSLYQIAETGKGIKSMHEFFFRDILGICGLDFKVEIPVAVAKQDKDGPYRDHAIVDFYLSNGEYFEIFGVEKNYGQDEEERDTYDKRKATKMMSWPNLWYWDATEFGSRTNRQDRTLSQYAEFLDTDCYHTTEGGPKSLLGYNYTSMLEERIPLLGHDSMAELDFYWAYTMGLPKDQLEELRSKIEGIRQRDDLGFIPMKTSQYNIEDYYKGGLPNIKTIYEALLNGQVAEGATPYTFPDGNGISKSTLDSIKTQEMLALYFQRKDVILPYLQQISDQMDAEQQQYEWNTDQNIPFPQQGEPQPQAPVLPQNDMNMPMQQPEQQVRASSSEETKTGFSEEKFNKEVKAFIKESEFFNRLFQLYEIPLDAIDEELTFHIVKLDGRHAKSKGSDIYINKKLMDKNSGNVSNILHFIVHEMIHWLTRQRESMCYFSDPEELEAFALGMAFELYRGRTEDEVRKTYFPIIEAHFEKPNQAEKLYNEFLKGSYVIIKKIFS